MGGFAHISEASGWLVAGLGIAVVFAGLVTLSLAISLFPRMVAWWEAQTKSPFRERFRNLVRRPSATAAPERMAEQVFDTEGLADAEEFLRLLTARLGEPFSLPRLLDIAEKRGLAKPHSTVNRLLLKRSLVPGPDGFYRWSKQSG
jgi:hypothetical protein